MGSQIEVGFVEESERYPITSHLQVYPHEFIGRLDGVDIYYTPSDGYAGGFYAGVFPGYWQTDARYAVSPYFVDLKALELGRPYQGNAGDYCETPPHIFNFIQAHFNLTR